MKTKELLHEKIGCIDLVKINRPEALNALNQSILTQFLELIISLESSHARVLIVTGEGPKAFIAGADIKEMQHLSLLEMLNFAKLGQDLTNALENASFVTLAAVNGYALGGGLEIALACDFIYASQQAKLGLPEVKLGLIPGFGGTQRLASAIGIRAAKELVLRGLPLSAGEAFALGLVNKVCEPENLLTECIATSEKILQGSYVAVSQAKQALNASLYMDLEAGLKLERNNFAFCSAMEESKTLISHFVTKKG
jgi:enoyl-CoA hydratase